jgi:outer membrane murein-binding lipoprotein Lpp
MKMNKPRLMLVAGAALAAGCASYPPPVDHLATSTASIRAAQEVGAPSEPQAALQMRLAQEENAKAEQFMAAGDNERADYMTMRANADAQLAVTMMRERQARARADGALAKLQEVGAKTTTTSATQTTTIVPVPAPAAPSSPTTAPPTNDTPATPATKTP